MIGRLPKSCGRRGAAKSEKPDAWGAASIDASWGHNRASPHKSYSLSYFPQVGLSESLSAFRPGRAASGIKAAFGRSDPLAIVARQKAITVRGASASRQHESVMP